MGKWATYRKRGSGNPLPALCPDVSAPVLVSIDEDESGINFHVNVPVDVPVGWFMCAWQSFDGFTRDNFIVSQAVALGELNGFCDPGDGRYLQFVATQLADGTGCQSAELQIHQL